MTYDAKRELTDALVKGEVYGPDSRNPEDWAEIEASVIRDLLRGVDASIHPDPRGLWLGHIRVLGQLDLDHVATDIPLHFYECDIPQGITARRSRLNELSVLKTTIHSSSEYQSIIDLSGATLHHLNLHDTELINHKGPALRAEGMSVDGNMSLSGLTAESTSQEGTVHLPGACITGQFNLSGAQLTNTNGPALSADLMKVGGNMFLRKNFTADGKGPEGAVRLPRAQIIDQLDMPGAQLTNTSGPALVAGDLHVGSIYLSDGFRADGAGPDGAVRLLGARVTGQLEIIDAELTNPEGPALIADRIQVADSMLLRGDFIARGAGPDGAVRLLGARIAGQLEIIDAELTNPEGPALVIPWLTVDKDFFLDISPLGSGALHMTDATVRGRLVISPRSLPPITRHPHPQEGWKVTGLTYRSLEKITEDQWLDLLAHGTYSYAPQPYQQLATAAYREGHEDVARRALIAQHDDQLNRSYIEPDLLTPREQFTKKILKYTVGYGYRPWLALLWLVKIIVIAGLFMHVMQQPGEALALLNPETQQCSGPCQNVDLWILASEIIPLLDGFETLCSPVIWHELFFLVLTFLKILAWGMLTLFIAGFTQIIRKPVAQSK